MTHSELAVQNFENGYNCAQSVVLAFSDVTCFDRETAAKLASGFGGGFGRLREVCGAFSGAVMVLSLLYGSADNLDTEAKAAHYGRVQKLAAAFREKYGSIICRELLAGIHAGEGGRPSERTPEYYKERPCARLVSGAAALVDDFIQRHPT